MALEFIKSLKACKVDDNIRAVVITGSGKAFCAGQDLNEVTGEDALPVEKVVSEHFNPLVRNIRDLDKPVIAAVNGVAAGAGANLALACDIVIATASASFIQAFSKIGLIPDSGGTYFLPRLIGLPRATALMMLGDKVSAKEAKAMGMIYAVSEDDAFVQDVQTLASRLANLPTKGLGLTKRALNYSLDNDIDKQLDIECQLQATACLSQDHVEGINSFLEKRKPTFTGQ
ncbi:UNVERIFIED_CONTAM: hypothetical protein GTU68_062857 [Idotea baltica]|nr:hypothetical protein [Idotea baltica]